MYPRDTRDPSKPGKLRLMYEANPIALIAEQAGGMAITGQDRILDVKPTKLHQRIALIFGSREEVERIESYHRDHSGRDFGTPKFKADELFHGAT